MQDAVERVSIARFYDDHLSGVEAKGVAFVAESSEPEPQAVVTPLTTAAIFLVVTGNPGGEEAVRGLLEDMSGLQRAVGFRIPGRLSCVTAIGSLAWDRLFDGPRPAGLHPFKELNGPRHRAPATPGDLLFHIRADRMDMCFELAAAT